MKARQFASDFLSFRTPLEAPRRTGHCDV